RLRFQAFWPGVNLLLYEDFSHHKAQHMNELRVLCGPFSTMNRSLIPLITGIVCLFLSYAASGQETGIASYYSDYLKGYKMANGERYDPEDLTCAHLSYPLGTILKVARKDNPDRSVMVIVVDRGPYIKGRIIDLSKRAAREIGMIDPGIAEVVVAVVKKPNPVAANFNTTTALASRD
ncbi:MAG TPA: septal ring lytic transglycosylase RlpA family protein, partial [Saprospiraceae bacterium]|nr:septal ring lytic transglycosylase RlpA family protein [Saprospiraceae bacterium]